MTDLETAFRFRYLPALTCDHYEVEQWMRRACARAYQKGHIDSLAIWLGKLHGRDLEARRLPNFSIRFVHSQIGYGLFTDQLIQKWGYVGEYTGMLRRRGLFKSDINDYCFMYPRAWVGLKAFTIDSEQQGNYTRFINHSDTPNLESIAVYWDGLFHVIFRAIEEIPAGTELRYDYGDLYWRHRTKHSGFT